MLDRVEAPPLKQLSKIKLALVEKTKLAELPSFILHDNSTDIITLEAIFDSGHWYEDKSGESFFSIKMLKEGTVSKSNHEINDELDYYGASLQTYSEEDITGIRLVVLKRYFAKVFPIFCEVLFNPRFSSEDLERIKNLQINHVKLYESRNKYLAEKRLKQMIFGVTHPYGRAMDEAVIQNIDVQGLINFYKNRLLSNCQLFLAGDINDQILSSIDLELTKLNKGLHNNLSHTAEDKVYKEYVDKPNSLQASVYIGKRTIKKAHKDFINLFIVNQLLGGYFGSRLMNNLREDKGYTYGVHSYIETYRHHSCLIIATDAIKKYKDDVCEQIFNEIKILQKNYVPEEELENLKNYLLGNTIIKLDNPFNYMTSFKRNHIQGIDRSYFTQMYNHIKFIDKEVIIEIANNYLNVNDFSSSIVG
jgi:zinc protease